MTDISTIHVLIGLCGFISGFGLRMWMVKRAERIKAESNHNQIHYSNHSELDYYRTNRIGSHHVNDTTLISIAVAFIVAFLVSYYK